MEYLNQEIEIPNDQELINQDQIPAMQNNAVSSSSGLGCLKEKIEKFIDSKARELEIGFLDALKRAAGPRGLEPDKILDLLDDFDGDLYTCLGFVDLLSLILEQDPDIMYKEVTKKLRKKMPSFYEYLTSPDGGSCGDLATMCTDNDGKAFFTQQGNQKTRPGYWIMHYLEQVKTSDSSSNNNRDDRDDRGSRSDRDDRSSNDRSDRDRDRDDRDRRDRDRDRDRDDRDDRSSNDRSDRDRDRDDRDSRDRDRDRDRDDR